MDGPDERQQHAHSHGHVDDDRPFGTLLAALPLLLLFRTSGQALAHVVTSEAIAIEVVRALVGGIGLVASVPITTGLAAIVATRSRDQPL